MKITAVTVTYGRKIGDPRPGKYGSIDNSVTLSATLDDADDPIDVARVLQQQAQTQVRASSLAWVRQVSREMNDIFEHLPPSIQRQIKETLSHGD